MKTKSVVQKWIVLLLLSALNAQLSTCFAQGGLTPPGAPGPTMKSLDQIEARMPISSAPFIITAPGSYYLTTNLTGPASFTNGITIVTNNVTLDLNGFALMGVPNSYDGVRISDNRTNITVRNGTLSGWGNAGVTGNGADNVLFQRLTVYGCSQGIVANVGVVSDCTVQTCNNSGIVAQNSTMSGCTIQACYDGIYAYNSTVSGCTVLSSSHQGIIALSSIVSGCRVGNSYYSGIYVNFPGCVIIGNNCLGNDTSGSISAAGIYINQSNNRVEDNHVTGSGFAGIQVSSSLNTNNIIIKNTVSGNGANNYLTPGNQVVGPLITTYGTITNANPWANFSF